MTSEPDVWQCSGASTVDESLPLGSPALCERFALAQVELRGDLRFDLFGVLDEERDRRRAGWGRGTQWVLFADAGRGWMVGEPDGGLTYRRGDLPRLGTYKTDLGFGIVLDDVGIYAAKSLSDKDAPINVFVRIKPRF